MSDRKVDPMEEFDAAEKVIGEMAPRELFEKMSHIAITMSYDLIDKLRYFEKDTLQQPDPEIATRVRHMAGFLESLKQTYLQFAEVDF